MLPCCVGSVRTLQLRTRLPCLCSGDEVIHDRIAFAGQNFKPLMTLRDAWAAEASSWLSQYGQLKRGYDREVEATKAAEARMNGRGSGDEPAAKRMRVRSGQVAKERSTRARSQSAQVTRASLWRRAQTRFGRA